MPSFTVEEILAAAEKDQYPNANREFITYKDIYAEDKSKIKFACVIGEAFLQLGLVENGIDASHLSYALEVVKPDEIPTVVIADGHPLEFDNLSDFINHLNGYSSTRGKKRIVKLVRKHFSKSLEQVVRF